MLNPWFTRLNIDWSYFQQWKSNEKSTMDHSHHVFTVENGNDSPDLTTIDPSIFQHPLASRHPGRRWHHGHWRAGRQLSLQWSSESAEGQRNHGRHPGGHRRRPPRPGLWHLAALGARLPWRLPLGNLQQIGNQLTCWHWLYIGYHGYRYGDKLKVWLNDG